MRHLKKFNEDIYNNDDYFTIIEWSQFIKEKLKGVSIYDEVKSILPLIGGKSHSILNEFVIQQNRSYSYLYIQNIGVLATELNKKNSNRVKYIKSFSIYKLEDEWYLLSANIDDSNIFYKCDQFEGLKKCIQYLTKRDEKMNESSNEYYHTVEYDEYEKDIFQRIICQLNPYRIPQILNILY